MASRKVRKPMIMAHHKVIGKVFKMGKITRKKSLKKKKKKKNKRFEMIEIRARKDTLIDYLPTEMIVEIVARVAAASTFDLFRCKQSCKVFQEIGDEKKVLQQAAIEDLYNRLWRNADKAKSFFKKCQDCNNPEALYLLGMVQYFANFMVQEGLESLEKSATQGYKDAIYALGLILLCSGDNQCKNRGNELLRDLIKVLKGEEIIERRGKLRNLMRTLQWMQDFDMLKTMNYVSLVMAEPKITCPLGELHEIKSNWEKDDFFHGIVEDRVVCEACKCGREAGFFCKLVTDYGVVHS